MTSWWSANERIPRDAVVVSPKYSGDLGNRFFNIAAAYVAALNVSAATGRLACLLLPRGHPTVVRHLPFLWDSDPATVWENATVRLLEHIDQPIPHGLRSLDAIRASAGVQTLLQTTGTAQDSWLFGPYGYRLRYLFGPSPATRAMLLRRFPELPDSIAYHVRGGDKTVLPRFYVCGSPYYTAALAALERGRNYTGLHFVSTEYPKLALSMPFFAELSRRGVLRFFDGNTSPLEDLWSLSLAGRGIITAASTFSWWSAYLRPDLATPVVMPPAIWRLGPERPGYFPEGWIVLNQSYVPRRRQRALKRLAGR